MPSVDKQGVQFDENGSIDVKVEGEAQLDEELQPNDNSEEEKDFSSPTDDDDLAWTGGLVTSYEDDVYGRKIQRLRMMLRITLN